MATKKPADLYSLRAANAAAKQALQAEQADTYGQVEALADVAARTQAAAAEYEYRLKYAASAGIWDDVLYVRPMPDGRIDLAPVLAAVLGLDVLAAAVGRYIPTLPASVDPAARAARVAQIKAELADLEDAEEVEILRLEALGLSPGRRGDADPAVVLRIRA